MCRREDIRILLGLLDPGRVVVRLQKRLVGVCILVEGPIICGTQIHITKPFGICINGCIDGYSRYVVWLEAYKTNNHPKVIAGYFTKAVLTYGGRPSRILPITVQRMATWKYFRSFSGETIPMNLLARRALYTAHVLGISESKHGGLLPESTEDNFGWASSAS